jgi:AcrR family transcriptional regulator
MDVFDLHEEGVAPAQIAKQLGLGRASVYRYLGDREYWDPHLDEVAIARAMGGDRPVFDNLTHFEWQAFGRRMAEVESLLPEADWDDYMRSLTRRLEPDDDAARGALRHRIRRAMGAEA